MDNHCVTLVWNPPSTFEIPPQVKSPLKSKFSPNAPSTPILVLFSSEYLKITIKWILHFNCYSVYLQNYQFPPITELETLTVTTNSFHSVTWCCLRFTWTTKHAIWLLIHGYLHSPEGLSSLTWGWAAGTWSTAHCLCQKCAKVFVLLLL